MLCSNVSQDIDKTKKLMNDCHSEIKRFQDLQSKIVYEQESIARKQIELKELDLKDQVGHIYLMTYYLCIELNF